MYKFFFISKNVLIQEEAAAAVPAPYPSFKPVNSKPSPDYKYQAFKAQNAAAVAGSSFSGSAAGSGFGGAPKLSGRPQPIAEEEDSFYGVDAQNFYAAERDAQPDRRQAPSSGDFAGAASNNDDGFGPFFGNGNFQSGPVSAAAAPAPAQPPPGSAALAPATPDATTIKEEECEAARLAKALGLGDDDSE